MHTYRDSLYNGIFLIVVALLIGVILLFGWPIFTAPRPPSAFPQSIRDIVQRCAGIHTDNDTVNADGLLHCLYNDGVALTLNGDPVVTSTPMENSLLPAVIYVLLIRNTLLPAFAFTDLGEAKRKARAFMQAQRPGAEIREQGNMQFLWPETRAGDVCPVSIMHVRLNDTTMLDERIHALEVLSGSHRDPGDSIASPASATSRISAIIKRLAQGDPTVTREERITVWNTLRDEDDEQPFRDYYSILKLWYMTQENIGEVEARKRIKEDTDPTENEDY